MFGAGGWFNEFMIKTTRPHARGTFPRHEYEGFQAVSFLHILESPVWVVGYESWVWWQWDVPLGGGDDASFSLV